MTGTERAMDNMVGQFEDQWFMIFWDAGLVGWMVRRKKGIEKSVESASAYEADIAYLHDAIHP